MNLESPRALPSRIANLDWPTRSLRVFLPPTADEAPKRCHPEIAIARSLISAEKSWDGAREGKRPRMLLGKLDPGGPFHPPSRPTTAWPQPDTAHGAAAA